jgi:subtilisin family serine protease
VQPKPTPNITAPQLDGYDYGPTAVYGSNITAAWRHSTGNSVVVALLDDGFDPITTSLFGDFSAVLSRNFAGGDAGDVGEPAGAFHGTTTSGLIGDSGAGGLPVGLAPNATIVGAKVMFGSAPFTTFVQALQYAAATADVINNSWVFNGFGSGEATDPSFAAWYAALQSAVQTGRKGLGDVVTFAAGNDRADGNSVDWQPLNSDPRVIAVAASDADGKVASYSNPGPGLLVTAIGDYVAVPLPGGQTYSFGSGTSYAAPTAAAIAALMLSANPKLGWRDVQEILADAAYMPAPSMAGSSFNNGAGWNGGGMHFSTDLGYGVVDANVAVNLARAWNSQSTDANLITAAATQSTAFTVVANGTAESSVVLNANVRVQHVQVGLADTGVLSANTRLVLISPDGTRSVLLNRAGFANGADRTNGLDLSGNLLTDNAFWGENGFGTWTLQVQDIGGAAAGSVQTWGLEIWGDAAATVAPPLVYTPEFASLAAQSLARAVVSGQGSGTSTLDLIALPTTTLVNLNGGAGLIDGVPVTVVPGLRNANADGSTGRVTLIGASGGSELTGGDATTTIIGAGHDVITAGLGATTINTGAGGSTVMLSAAVLDTVISGGGDTIWAGAASVSVRDVGARGDVIHAQAGRLSFVGGSGASIVFAGKGTVMVQAGSGGGTFYAGSAGGSVLTAGSGAVVLRGAANGDVLTAAGAANDTLMAGAGTETLSGAAATGSITLVGGSGYDTMTAGAGHSRIVVGTGDSAITLRGIADIVTFQNGAAGGLATVSGFRLGIDALHLAGYPRATAASALLAQASDGFGGSLLSLSDGTRIDMVGVAPVGASAFA